ncbi:hypothetical protein A9K66_00015 [Mesorhizobium sp. AA23]|nr:hypothetical protein A9K66_00015 [Mesorhizobium sp. AA23]
MKFEYFIVRWAIRFVNRLLQDEKVPPPKQAQAVHASLFGRCDQIDQTVRKRLIWFNIDTECSNMFPVCDGGGGHRVVMG